MHTGATQIFGRIGSVTHWLGNLIFSNRFKGAESARYLQIYASYF